MTDMGSLQCILALVLVAVSSVAQSTGVQECRCRTEKARDITCTGNDYFDAYHHDTLGLAGDCLPRVEANTMMCFRTAVTTDCCSLRLRPNDTRTTLPLNGAHYLDSPNLQINGRFRKRLFCIYNVSLSDECDGMVAISSVNVNISSNRGKDRVMELAAKSNGECGDYLQFDFGYFQSDKLCGTHLNDYEENVYNMSSFLAFFWSDNELPNRGGFRIRVGCEGALLAH